MTKFTFPVTRLSIGASNSLETAYYNVRKISARYLCARDEQDLNRIEGMVKNSEYDFGDSRTVLISIIDVSSLPHALKNKDF